MGHVTLEQRGTIRNGGREKVGMKYGFSLWVMLAIFCEFLHEVGYSVPEEMFEDLRSTDKDVYNLGALVVTIEPSLYTFVKLQNNEKW